VADNGDTRIKRLGYRPPTSTEEPDQLVHVEYVSNGRIAIITLNRPHADNAITTELAAQLIEVLETIAARPAVRAVSPEPGTEPSASEATSTSATR
jgi:Enoyl-CoA hydratase/isomerase